VKGRFGSTPAIENSEANLRKGWKPVIRSSRILTAKVRLDEGKTSLFRHETRRRLEIWSAFQAHRLGLVRRAERKYKKGEIGDLEKIMPN
jgi:hypothetical protein